MTYNGWSNRETWLVDLHLGDRADYHKEESDDLQGFVDRVESDIDGEFDEAEAIIYGADAEMSSFIRDIMPDFLSLRREIDVDELVEAWTSGGTWCWECNDFFEFDDPDHKGKAFPTILADGTEVHTCGNCVVEEEWP